MNGTGQPQLNPTEVAHRDLKNVLLNGRVLINGLSLTGNELGTIIQGEQMLFEKAMQLDKTKATQLDKAVALTDTKKETSSKKKD